MPAISAINAFLLLFQKKKVDWTKMIKTVIDFAFRNARERKEKRLPLFFPNPLAYSYQKNAMRDIIDAESTPLG